MRQDAGTPGRPARVVTLAVSDVVGSPPDVIASVIYKEYEAGFYGLSAAGNVILFLVVTVIMVPLAYVLNRKQVEL